MIQEILRSAQQQLQLSDSARLDAEVLVAHVLGVDRSFLYTWPERELTPAQQQQFSVLLARRVNGEPIAHLTGKKEFYSLLLEVNAATLIPRPETELLVELALAQLPEANCRVLDLGTGTGAIALALAYTRPQWKILAVDREPRAVELAQRNAQTYGLANVELRQSDWFASVPETDFDLIISNPPYIAEHDTHLQQGDVRFEPRSALVAAGHGLADIKHIAAAAHSHLRAGGFLLLEHGYEQGATVRETLQRNGYHDVMTHCDLESRERVTLGCKP